MIIKKPSIFIYTFHPDKEILREICAGMEEEGVFYEISEQTVSALDELSWLAANDSMLGSGIGVSETKAALQMRGIKKGHNLEAYDRPDKAKCRKLGANSARAIKKQPFK